MGVFGMMVKMLGIDVDYYFNEINLRLLRYLKYLSAELNRSTDSEVFHVIQGTETKTQFPVELKKIIMRNAFHHFSRKRKMIKSIFESLINGCELYLMEPTKELSSCFKVMEQFRIIKLVTSKYFVLDQKKDIHGTILYRFIRK